jgi:hypothetical protein
VAPASRLVVEERLRVEPDITPFAPAALVPLVSEAIEVPVRVESEKLEVLLTASEIIPFVAPGRLVPEKLKSKACAEVALRPTALAPTRATPKILIFSTKAP